VSSLLVFWLRSKVAGSSVVVTQKRGFAIFDTREPAYTTVVDAHKNQISIGGQRLGEYQLSPGLHHTSQQ
jgi:hypothetical protein